MTKDIGAFTYCVNSKVCDSGRQAIKQHHSSKTSIRTVQQIL
jgi:hypothetical protein